MTPKIIPISRERYSANPTTFFFDRFFLRFHKSNDLITEMTDSDIRDFAKSFCKGILNGESSDMKCWMVCAPMVGYLNAVGIKCELVEGEVAGQHHYWIGFPDKFIIDPTADQFGRKNLWLKPIPTDYIGYYTPIS